jgi:hypothetical protein
MHIYGAQNLHFTGAQKGEMIAAGIIVPNRRGNSGGFLLPIEGNLKTKSVLKFYRRRILRANMHKT